MNLTGVGSPSPGLNSGRFFNTDDFPIRSSSSTRVPASQRLLQTNNYVYYDGDGVVPRKKPSVPSRKREEAIALQNLSRLIAMAPPIKTSPERLISRYLRPANNKRLDLPWILRRLTIKKGTDCSVGEEIGSFSRNTLNDKFVLDALFWHNFYRKQHHVQPLKISSQLCEKAQTWANHLAHTNTFAYSTDKSVGQNIFCRLSNGKYQNDVTAEEVVSYWYSAYKNYAYFSNSDILHTNINAGSFTQLIWNNTEYFGIGRAVSRYGKLSVVANYQPAGNICGHFQQNVKPPKRM